MKVITEQSTAVKCITEIADRYRELFSFGMDAVREGIEEATAKFGSVISKDTLDQINKESKVISERLATFNNDQQKKITQLADDIKGKVRHLEGKHDRLKETTDKHSKMMDRLSAASTNSIKKISDGCNKLQTINKTHDELHKKLDNRLDQLNVHVNDYKIKMERVSKELTKAVERDMGYLSGKMKDAQKSISDNKHTLRSYKSDFAAIRQQMMPLLRSLSETTLPSSASSASSTSSTSSVPASLSSSSSVSSSSSSVSTTKALSNTSDSEIIKIKSSVNQLDAQLKEIQRLVTFLVGGGEQSSLNTYDKSAWEAVPKRLNDLEMSMIYLLSKVEVMEPQHKHAFTDLKDLINNNRFDASEISNPKTVNSNDIAEPTLTSRGTKRPLEIASDSEMALFSDIKRVELKLTDLVDYIHQFKDNILDPSFPEKLDSGLQQFDACLRTHETFIAYLVDPRTAIQHTMADSSISNGAEQSQKSPLKITPDLLTTISQYIADETQKSLQIQKDKIASPPPKKQKTAYHQPEKHMVEYMEKHMKQMMMDHVDPLKKRIQELEQQLQQKKQHK
ncbi:unnamed protein product [Absidia cylindrospora]